jgi:hypothetical protein
MMHNVYSCISFFLLFLIGNLLAATPLLALGGYDVVACINGSCAVGDASYSTVYTSVDKAGNPIFSSSFRFSSQSNLMAFEVSKMMSLCVTELFAFHLISPNKI